MYCLLTTVSIVVIFMLVYKFTIRKAKPPVGNSSIDEFSEIDASTPVIPKEFVSYTSTSNSTSASIGRDQGIVIPKEFVRYPSE